MDRQELQTQLTKEDELQFVTAVIQLLTTIMAFVPEPGTPGTTAGAADIDAELRAAIKSTQEVLARWRAEKSSQARTIRLDRKPDFARPS